MTLSIVILTCDQREFTRRVLLSLDGLMSAETDCEIVLVDNGSTDGTSEMVASLGLSWADRLKYIYSDTNLGLAVGRNTGLRAASGRVLMILDNDTIADATAIRHLCRRVTSDKSIGVIAPALYSPGGERQDSAKPFPGLGIKLRHFISQAWKSGREAMPEGEHEPCYVIGACQMFRREVLEAVGSLDEKIFYGPEDADFCIRVRDAGYRIVYDPSVRIVHDWQRATSRKRFSPLARRHMAALLYFYKKHKRIF